MLFPFEHFGHWVVRFVSDLSGRIASNVLQ